MVPIGRAGVDALARLFERLRAAGYTSSGLRVAIGSQTELPAVPTRVDALAMPDQILATLLKLFLFTDGVDVDLANEALAADRLRGLIEAGILAKRESRIRSSITVFPYEDFLVVADAPSYAAADFVNGPGPSALTLAGLMIRRKVGFALDIGTGSGIHALLTARFSDEVVAADISPRAVGYAGLNIILNGVTNVECRTGSWCEPVQGMQFDLVVANPPFVISPESRWIFRDSGPQGDAVCRRLVQEVPAYLAAGGIAQIMCSWVHSRDDDWLDTIQEWVGGLGCDALVLHHASFDPVRYAAAWHADLALKDPAQHERTVKAWVAHYEEQGMRRLATGLITLRRARAAPTWTHALEMPGPVRGSASDQLLRIFAGQDFLHSHRDRTSLLAHAYRPVDGHRVEQTMLYHGGGYEAQQPAITLESGTSVVGRLDPEAVHVLFRLDGSRSLGDIVAETARETGFDAAGLADKSMAMVADLLGRGVLVPAGDAATLTGAR